MSIFSNLKPQGGNKLHPFDLSRRDVFSVKSGVLNVNFIQHTIPESKYDVSHAQITRTDAIQTASFARMSENFEYYFIPYSQIFHDFERLYYERGDIQRNVNNNGFGSQDMVSSILPVFSYSEVFENLAKYFIVSRLYLKVCEQLPSVRDSLRQSIYTQFDPYDTTNWYMPFDVHGEICIDEMVKLFDMLGYGNLYSVLNSLISPFFAFSLPSIEGLRDEEGVADAYNDALRISLISIFGGDLSSSGFVEYNGIASLFESNFSIALDQEDKLKPDFIGNDNLRSAFYTIAEDFVTAFLDPAIYPLLSSKIQDFNVYKPNILPLASYVKVFSDVYRNTQFDNDNYSELFNFDYVVQDAQATIDTSKVLMMLIPRFRQYKKDVFTGVFPNAQFGSVAVSSLQNPSTLQISNPSSNNNAGLYATSLYENGKVYQIHQDQSRPVSKFIIDSGVSALAVRQALSLQRYKERILRAGNRLTALQNAVFGDRSRFLEDAYVQFVGAEKNNIDFNSVAATSDAGVSEVGQLGSNGVGTHVGKAFEFHSHDFGILMGIYYVLPESEYESYMIDPMNTKSETNDFYKPDFMNLGLSPVWNYNFNFLGMGNIDDKVLGYLANYWEYKTSIDKVHGNFYASLPERAYNGVSLPRLGNTPAFVRGQNANYVTPRLGYAITDGLTLGSLYVNPHDIDSIFYINSDFTIDTDQFKVNCNHDVKALLPMSVVGLPEY